MVMRLCAVVDHVGGCKQKQHLPNISSLSPSLTPPPRGVSIHGGNSQEEQGEKDGRERKCSKPPRSWLRESEGTEIGCGQIYELGREGKRRRSRSSRSRRRKRGWRRCIGGSETGPYQPASTAHLAADDDEWWDEWDLVYWLTPVLVEQEAQGRCEGPGVYEVGPGLVVVQVPRRAGGKSWLPPMRHIFQCFCVLEDIRVFSEPQPGTWDGATCSKLRDRVQDFESIFCILIMLLCEADVPCGPEAHVPHVPH